MRLYEEFVARLDLPLEVVEVVLHLYALNGIAVGAHQMVVMMRRCRKLIPLHAF
jgi:hypothetical protein